MNDVVSNSENINADDVASYLKKNVDFFQDYPDLFLMMKFSDQAQGTISLVDRQMQGLRKRNAEFETELNQVIVNAQDNQHLLQQTISLSLNLIPCENIENLANELFNQLSELFGINFHNLLLDQTLFADKTDLAVDMHAIREALGDNFPKQQPVCGRLKAAEKKSLFVEDVPVKSVAILPLGEAGEIGLLVLGSEDESHFDPEMGDLFLILIADTLGRLLSKYK